MTGPAPWRRRHAIVLTSKAAAEKSKAPLLYANAYSDEIDAAAVHLSPAGRGRNGRALRVRASFSLPFGEG